MRLPFLLLISMLPACTATPSSNVGPDIERGQYLVTLLACGRCHTEGYLTGNQPTGPYLAGSRIGIAYTAYSEDETHPGVVFPSNLTPDDETGLGAWSEEEIIRAMTAGVAKSGHERLTVMPWANYTALRPGDLQAVARYLKSLAPVSRKLPQSIAEGDPIDQPYVRFGVYEFSPHGGVRAQDLPRPNATRATVNSQ